jgi:biopolymer transport protein ExbB
MTAPLTGHPLVVQALEIWVDGGWGMIALAVNAYVLFAVGASLWLRVRGKRFRRVPEKLWRSWIANPGERSGPVGRLLEFVMGAQTVREVGVRFSELHKTELAPFSRDLKFMRRAVSTAPLLGLLGTVTGMLTTFDALASGAGGEQTMDQIASGISEALITTETGLVIALPGLFLQYHLARQRDRYSAFLAHLETACTQYVSVWSEVRGRASDSPRESEA